MPEPFIGEIRMFGGNFAPVGWSFCDGQLIPISQNDVLFTIIGTTYGGDGQETFALPNLQSRVPMHVGNGFVLGQSGGTESVTLTTQQIPVHNHALLVSTTVGQQTNPSGNVVAQSTQATQFIEDQTNVSLAATVLVPVGGSQPHENMQPYLTLMFVIALQGIYPSRT